MPARFVVLAGSCHADRSGSSRSASVGEEIELVVALTARRRRQVKARFGRATFAAERITRERESRELSYEALAKFMTDQGCPLAGSAIYRIEKGDPPRHITVDELVAFANVFDTTVPDLLAPMELVRKEKARELVERTLSVWRALPAATSELYTLCKEFYALQQSDPDLHEFFANQWLKAADELPSVPLTSEVGAALTKFTKTVVARANADAVVASSSRRARRSSGKRTGKVRA